MTPRPALADFLARRPAVLRRGPIAIVLIEDGAAVAETLRHHARLGFRHILALSPDPVALADDLAPCVTLLDWDTRRAGACHEAVNAILPAVPPGTWLYYCYNAEFLFFPFSESRSVGEMLAFHAEERREAMLSYVIDLYAPDLGRNSDGVNLSEAMFDRAGYFALARPGPDGRPLDRQLDFHGGLRWRFEEHLAPESRRIDRIALFRAAPGLRMTADHRFSVAEYNTHACRWHNNLTAAIASFRAAKALAGNPGSRDAITTFRWSNAERFEWRSQQLMDLGLMEPGQWF